MKNATTPPHDRIHAASTALGDAMNAVAVQAQNLADVAASINRAHPHADIAKLVPMLAKIRDDAARMSKQFRSDSLRQMTALVVAGVWGRGGR